MDDMRSYTLDRPHIEWEEWETGLHWHTPEQLLPGIGAQVIVEAESSRTGANITTVATLHLDSDGRWGWHATTGVDLGPDSEWRICRWADVIPSRSTSPPTK